MRLRFRMIRSGWLKPDGLRMLTPYRSVLARSFRFPFHSIPSIPPQTIRCMPQTPGVGYINFRQRGNGLRWSQEPCKPETITFTIAGN